MQLCTICAAASLLYLPGRGNGVLDTCTLQPYVLYHSPDMISSSGSWIIYVVLHKIDMEHQMSPSEGWPVCQCSELHFYQGCAEQFAMSLESALALLQHEAVL